MRFPALTALDAAARRLLEDHARVLTLPEGAVVFRDGSRCENYLLVIEGSVRVQKVSEGGREIVLYRVDAGQSCVLTTSCLLAGDNHGAEGVAETRIDAVALSAAIFTNLLDRSPVFRTFVFSTYATRIAGLLMLIEEVAFGRIGTRLSLLTAAIGWCPAYLPFGIRTCRAKG